MLADSPDAILGLKAFDLTALGAPIPAIAATAPTPDLAGLATGWLLLLFILGSASALPSVLAAILRRRLPPDPRLETTLEPVAFGHSPRVLRAPRHAVSSHRSLVTNVSVIALGLVLMAYAAASRSLGSGGLIVAILFTLPTLLVALHARRRTGPPIPTPAPPTSAPPPASAPPPTPSPTPPSSLPEGARPIPQPSSPRSEAP